MQIICGVCRRGGARHSYRTGEYRFEPRWAKTGVIHRKKASIFVPKNRAGHDADNLPRRSAQRRARRATERVNVVFGSAAKNGRNSPRKAGQNPCSASMAPRGRETAAAKRARSAKHCRMRQGGGEDGYKYWTCYVDNIPSCVKSVPCGTAAAKGRGASSARRRRSSPAQEQKKETERHGRNHKADTTERERNTNKEKRRGTGRTENTPTHATNTTNGNNRKQLPETNTTINKNNSNGRRDNTAMTGP